jgi:hypothetical protein
MRQHVSTRTGNAVSNRMAKVVVLILCVSLCVVFAFSQVMHWHVVDSFNKIEELKTVRVVSSSKHIELLAMRAQLSSRKIVEERASEKLRLFAPERNQIRRL